MNVVAINKSFYRPASDRIRPGILEMVLILPANSVSSLSFDFDKAFLKYTEHSPDANRGFDIG